MLGKLFIKELKYQFTHIPIYIIAFCFILNFYVNFDHGHLTSNIIPKQNQYNSPQYYGRTHDDNFETIMRNAYDLLSYYSNYGKYLKSYGDINKYVNLNKQQKEVIDFVLKCLVPKSLDDESSFKLSKEQFKSLMHDVNTVLNGNKQFSREGIKRFKYKHKSYEEALKDYKQLADEDKITNAYGRLFADYMGIAVGFLPVLITAFTLLRDKRYRIHEFVFCSRIKTIKYILSKYLSNVVAIFSLVLVLAIYTTVNFYIFSINNSVEISIFGFVKYSILWVLPTIMFVVALSYLLQLLFNSSIVAIVIQFVLWEIVYRFSDNQYALYKFVLRFNKVIPYSSYEKYIKEICINRIFISIMSIILLLLVCFIWDKKRENIDYNIKFPIFNKN